MNLLNMNRVLLLLLHFIFLIFIIDVRAQVQQNPHGANNFHPSLPLVITFLSIMFFLTFLLLLYAKFCHRGPDFRRTNLRIRDGQLRLRSSASGIDKKVIESLPFFRFSSLRGSRDGLECSVCLSKFEDVEILRLLPKCKHAFHIDCIDQWLEKHSTCPLCRRKIGPEDVSELPYSNSLRLLGSQSLELSDESNFELYVQREENGLGSSRFSVGRSFRLLSHDTATKEEEAPIQRGVDSDQFKKRFHRFNHRVVGSSDVVFKNRWSNVSSSDLVFLNSEFLNDESSARFMSKGSVEVEGVQKENDQLMSTTNQTGHSFLNFPGLPTTSDSTKNFEFESNFPCPIDKRSMSEIVVHPRFTEFEDNTDSFAVENGAESERIRRLWIPIARKTAQWFTNRESRPPNSQGQ